MDDEDSSKSEIGEDELESNQDTATLCADKPWANSGRYGGGAANVQATLKNDSSKSEVGTASNHFNPAATYHAATLHNNMNQSKPKTKERTVAYVI